MSLAHRLITVREWQSVPYGVLGDPFVSALERVARRTGGEPFRFGRDAVQATRFVGAVRFGNTTLQVLPKGDRSDADALGGLVHLLRITRELSLRPTGRAALSVAGGSLLEVWARHFAETLNGLLKRDPRRSYVEVEERTRFLKGRLLVQQMTTGREALTGIYPCRYRVFTSDHALNRILKRCNRIVRRTASSAHTLRVLRENDALLADVADVEVTVADIDRIHLDRLNRAYEPVLAWCRLVLTNATPDLNSGATDHLAFLFDMDRLFEGFVAAFLRAHADRIVLPWGRPLCAVHAQRTLGRLFGALRMSVDLVLRDAEGRELLLDTKNKTLKGTPGRDDLYQMYAYGRAADRPCDDVLLLYPRTTREWWEPSEVKLYVHSGLRLHARCLDLSAIHDPETGAPNMTVMIAEFNRVFASCPVPPPQQSRAVVDALLSLSGAERPGAGVGVGHGSDPGA